MTWREISCDQFNSLKRATLVDVRSPCEYSVEHIPGSINIPLFTDEERDFIGTVYARDGELVARRKAMDIIAPKIPRLIDEVVAARGGDNAPIVIHCWRGGLRSEAVASCLSIVGIDSLRLTGGYKAWRQVVLRDFESDQYRFKMVVLQGHTGSGKTDILKELEAAGAKVIDLEKLANHRGSVFGALGLGAQPSQKDFDARLWMQLKSLGKYDGFVFAEAESKNIGRLRLPMCIYSRLQAAPKIFVNGSFAVRCDRILADYTGGLQEQERPIPPEFHQAALSALAAIKERLPGPIYREVQEFFSGNQLRPAVELLLEHYYDHYYQKHIDKEFFALTVSGDDPKFAATKISKWVDAHLTLQRGAPGLGD